MSRRQATKNIAKGQDGGDWMGGATFVEREGLSEELKLRTDP